MRKLRGEALAAPSKKAAAAADAAADTDAAAVSVPPPVFAAQSHFGSLSSQCRASFQKRDRERILSVRGRMAHAHMARHSQVRAGWERVGEGQRRRRGSGERTSRLSSPTSSSSSSALSIASPEP